MTYPSSEADLSEDAGREVDTTGMIDRVRLADDFAQLALDAAVAIMRVYTTRGCAFHLKADQSPVSEADEQAEVVILAGLKHCAPGIPVLAEEAAARGSKPALDGQFILVDPVDGTKEFIGGSGEFTVNIALIEAGRPVVGVVYAPVLKRLWSAAGGVATVCRVEPGQRLADATERRSIHARTAPNGAYVALASRSHSDAPTEAFLANLPVRERREAGSSLKFCAIAEGDADLYPRFGPTMEWDTAAGDAVLRAAGGVVLSLAGGPLLYGKTGEDYRNGGFVAWGDPIAGEREEQDRLADAP
ncbi:3'(2'),5'-bisphosphate nucleotidase CysQ [Lichenihabitans psoromatis]|uniref:3'(2'),5'-bisphosphate nucleotidase CysQ n=1 Tax=Lichenihabitans psoromatis TaxID=2528642 RepID=UPI001FE1820D|nr:3'(2'),5'-bisphosphate nucleotidase CysQ [Lichenihabitans psoromatis]